MKTHFNTHKGIHRVHQKKHKCPLCREAYARRESLLKHLRDKHHLSSDAMDLISKHGIDSDIAKEVLSHNKSPNHAFEYQFMEIVKEEENQIEFANEFIMEDSLV